VELLHQAKATAVTQLFLGVALGLSGVHHMQQLGVLGATAAVALLVAFSR
jgi:hypothetical protein